MRILKPSGGTGGDLHVKLFNVGNGKDFRIHRLVAEAFVPNPDVLPEINHRDEDTRNNRAENLEWCTPSYNSNYGTRNQRIAKKHSKPVICVETCEVFASAKDVERQKGYNNSYISKVCNGKYKTSYGYHWQFV